MAKSRILVGANTLFSPYGRVNRLQFALYFWACLILMFAILYLVDWLPDALNDDLAAHIHGPLTWFSMVMTVLLYYALFCVLAMRLHDVGLTAWLALVLFAGFASGFIALLLGETVDNTEAGTILDLISFAGNVASLVMGLVLSFWPGNPGDNHFGPSPNAENAISDTAG